MLRLQTAKPDPTRALRGIAAGLRGRPGTFTAAAAVVFALAILGPPLVLSLARTPVDYFTVNPWLKRLPAYLASPEVPIRDKLAKLPDLALFWFSADSPYGVDWGFAVDVRDLVRIALTSALFGVYFALWAYRRSGAIPSGPRMATGRRGGVLGALGSVFGFSTGPCSVMGCGAPVIPVIGLAFAGLSSGTLSLLASVSRVATSAVLVGLILAIAYLGWRAGGTTPGGSS